MVKVVLFVFKKTIHDKNHWLLNHHKNVYHKSLHKIVITKGLITTEMK